MRIGFSTFAVFTLSIVPMNANVINFVDVFRNQFYTQATAAQPTTPGYYLGARGFLQSAGDFNGGTFNGSLPLTLSDSLTLSYGSPVYSTLSAFNSAFPLTNYSFHLTDSTAANPSAPDDVTVINPGTAPYATSIPYLTDFSALSGYNGSSPFTFTFNSFTGPTSDSFVFFGITRTSDNASVFNASFLSNSTTSVTVPGGTLQPGKQYDFDLVFSNRLSATQRGSAVFNPVLGFDSRTDGVFTTSSVPEPVTVGISFCGLLSLIALKRRSRSALQ